METPSNKTTTIHRNMDHVEEVDEEEAIDDTDGGKRTDLQENVVVGFAVATSNGVVDNDDTVVVGGNFNCRNAFCSENNDALELQLELTFALVLKWDFLRWYPFCLAGLVVMGPKSISFEVTFNDAFPVDSILA